MNRSGLVTLLTDFGPGSIYVGQMHATLLRVAPSVRVVDLAHDCPAGGITAAAYMLQRSYGRLPRHTTHVAVVDAGVGSARAILAGEADGHFFLAPDNGLLGGLLGAAEDVVVRRVENEALMNERVSRTFHGRDIFAPVAAHIARGGKLSEVGPECEWEPARPGAETNAGAVDGCVLIVDHFGNLISDIPSALLDTVGARADLRVRLGDMHIDSLRDAFEDVPRGVALTYVGSGGHLEIAVNAGRASDLLGLGVGAPVRVERRA